MKTPRFLRAASWPAKSTRRCGRTAVSSSGRFSAEMSLRGASATSAAFARGMKAIRQSQFRSHGEPDHVCGEGATSDQSMAKREADRAWRLPMGRGSEIGFYRHLK